MILEPKKIKSDTVSMGKSMDRGGWEAIVHGSQRVGNDRAHIYTG